MWPGGMMGWDGGEGTRATLGTRDAWEKTEAGVFLLFPLRAPANFHMMLTARAAGRADCDRFITHLSDMIGGVFTGPRVGGIAQSLSRRSTGAGGGRQGSKRWSEQREERSQASK